MPTLRVMFKYNNRSPLSNVVTVERIKFDSKEDGTKWLAAYRVLMDRKKVDKEINSYGWVNQPKGVVRSPVSEAMKITVSKYETAQ